MGCDEVDRRFDRDDEREPTRHAEKRDRVGAEIQRELVDARTVPCVGELALFHSTARITDRLFKRHCDGCDEHCTNVRDFIVTHHDGATSAAAYCTDCADLARVDWNGETKSIEVQ